MWMDWDFISQEIIPRNEGEHVCGLHGCHPVDPEGPQLNLNNRGSCWYSPAKRYEQLALF